MNETILILGASGLLGHCVLSETRKRYGHRVHGIYNTPRNALQNIPHLHQLDLLDLEKSTKFIVRLKPKYVINCCGITNKIRTIPYNSVIINSALPHLLENILSGWEGRLIQISTDCVFSGKRGNYSENDTPDPIDFYSQTKLLGEVHKAPHLTIRTSFIGYELETENGLLAWFLKQQGAVSGFRKTLWSGVTNLYLASLINELLVRKEITGLLNVSGEFVSKYLLLKVMAEVFNRKDLKITSVDTPSLDRSLNNNKLRQYGFDVPPIKKMLEKLSGVNDQLKP